MRRNFRAGAAALLVGWAAAPATAQDAGPLPRPDDVTLAAAAASPEDGLLSDAELDSLLGPVALFPDALLTQILVASTYPLDLVKADRWIAANAALAAEARQPAAEGEGWDPSVAVLAAGFPTVVARMAEDLDRTETLGNAMLVQTDDVLDSIQRLRGQAEATGYLASNEAQTVTVDGGAISIAPTDPEVVYVPRYDPALAYTAAPTQPAYVYEDSGYDTNDLLMTGAIAFGSALLVNEIFEDDDDWNGYWGPSYGHIDWDDGDFYPRPDVDIDIDEVNIDRDRFENIDGERLENIDRDRLDEIDRDRLANVDRERLEAIDRDRLGAVDPDRPRRDGAWQADPERRDAARAKLESRPSAANAERRASAERLGAGVAAGAASAAGGGAARANLEKAAARRDAAPPRAPAKASPFEPRGEGAIRQEAARDRGAASLDRDRAPSKAAPRPAVAKGQAKLSKPSAARVPPKKAAPKSSAFKKSSGGKAKAARASSRGGGSKGARKR